MPTLYRYCCWRKRPKPCVASLKPHSVSESPKSTNSGMSHCSVSNGWGREGGGGESEGRDNQKKEKKPPQTLKTKVENDDDDDDQV